jgi:ribosome-associated protein
MTANVEHDFELQDEFIPLDALLKAVGLASSGGAAKAAIAAGEVQVDGELETRKRRKVRAGQLVTIAGTSIRVLERKQAAE